VPLLDYFMALLQLMRLYGVRCDVEEGCVFRNVPIHCGLSVLRSFVIPKIS